MPGADLLRGAGAEGGEDYTITATGLEHDSLLVNGEAATLTEGVVTVHMADEIAITVDNGYVLKALIVTDANDEAVAVQDDSFTMPAGNVTLTAKISLPDWKQLQTLLQPAAATSSARARWNTIPTSWPRRTTPRSWCPRA